MPFVVQQTDSGLIGRPKLTCVTLTAAVVRSMARRWTLRCQLHQSVRASVDQTGASCAEWMMSVWLIGRPFHSAFVKGLRQQGQSPSIPLASPMNAVGWGIVIIALKASGSRCA